MERQECLEERLAQKGVTRRDFMKFCTLVSATMGLAPSFVPKVAEALTNPQRPPVVWLHFAECTGCTEAVLRNTYPWIDELLLETISVDYHETIMAAAGHSVEEVLQETVKKYEGKFICVVEGAIPTAENGIYGMIGGKTMLDIAKEVCPKALATICIGTCSSFGGVQAAAPNPTGAKGVADALGDQLKTPVVNVPGCPPNPINFVGTVVNYLLFGKLPELDDKNRPLFAYGKTVHDQCPRRSHFENGEFVEEWGSEEAKMGYCLYQMGCKGPETFNNCPKVKFNEGTSWPVQAGHPCIGCSEPDFWDSMSPFYESL
ncbi:[NiFe] hydrogenase small subunit [Desulfacinum hydrothermale DSM 13146]|uniref:[NiFe] hydrogenase small subunit n=2 Tax=Desulfacinum hydrothermale TaxID=109258 RepID=A0A1W1XUN4_9BACT|nr:hydrogenase small subunit [Desulfacinum hydrothermale]SMC27228.1 [NiFe] hydrogenase small subunit [Desulfacinum hydrothermale DSM 13146]